MTTITTSNGIKFVVENDKYAKTIERSIGRADALRVERNDKHEEKKMASWLKMRAWYEKQEALREKKRKELEKELLQAKGIKLGLAMAVEEALAEEIMDEPSPEAVQASVDTDFEVDAEETIEVAE